MKTKVLITVRGGMIEEIASNNPSIKIYVADRDNDLRDLFIYHNSSPDKLLSTTDFNNRIKKLEVEVNAAPKEDE